MKAQKDLQINFYDKLKLKKILENKDMLVISFLKNMLHDKFPACLIYNKIYEYIMLELNIHSLHNNTFYLDI